MARLMDGLRTRLGDDWLIVFAADHGESLGEHGFFYDHGDYVYNASLRVLLVFALPPDDPRARPEVVEDWVSLVDVLPTLAALLDLDLDPALTGQIEGRSLSNYLEGGPRHCNRCSPSAG